MTARLLGRLLRLQLVDRTAAHILSKIFIDRMEFGMSPNAHKMVLTVDGKHLQEP